MKYRSFVGTIVVFICMGYTAQASALTIGFNTSQPGETTFHGSGGSYTESAFTFTAEAGTGTAQFTIASTNALTNAPPDGSGFNSFEAHATATFSLTSPYESFTLEGFQAASIFNTPTAETLTLTGHIRGGGTLVEVFNLPAFSGTAVWTTFTLPATWVNLTSVDFASTHFNLGVDNVIVSGYPVPAPTLSIWLLSLLTGVLLLVGFKRKET